MDATKNIEHTGIVQDITDTVIYVKILSQSACAACHAKTICGMSEMKEKLIEVERVNQNIQIGDEVTVLLKESLGFKALFLGYLAPFIILFVILIALISYTANELLSGLCALSSLVPYYIILFLFKSKIRKEFKFIIK